MSLRHKSLRWGALVSTLIGSAGCMHSGWRCSDPVCDPCQPACGECMTQGSCEPCGSGVAPCGGRVSACASRLEFAMFGWACRKSNAVPETLPLGSTVRSHIQVMETNAEASDFIMNQKDFVGQTAALTPAGKDHILEIAARMRSAPFPVLVERTTNNSDPELDALRRNLVATILTDLGNPDAQQRTVVATPYGPGYTGNRAEQMYYQHIYSGGFNNGTFGGGGGFSGGGSFGGF